MAGQLARQPHLTKHISTNRLYGAPPYYNWVGVTGPVVPLNRFGSLGA